jgi:hypothetical protein
MMTNSKRNPRTSQLRQKRQSRNQKFNRRQKKMLGNPKWWQN